MKGEIRKKLNRWRHSQPNSIWPMSPSLSFYLTFNDIDLPKKNPLFSFCFVSSFFLWKRGTWGKVLWNFESIVIFSKPRKRYRTGWRNFHETLSSFVRKQRSQMNEIDDRRFFHEQIKSHVSLRQFRFVIKRPISRRKKRGYLNVRGAKCIYSGRYWFF